MTWLGGYSRVRSGLLGLTVITFVIILRQTIHHP
jgi:hypothetical protein